MIQNETKRLPDAYAKDTNSNNYKILQLLYLLNADTRADLQSIEHASDIANASGKTLDKFGEMYGQARNGANDEQYRFLIMYKISKMTTKSDCNSIINSLETLFNTDGGIKITEGNLTAKVEGVSIETIENTGFTNEQIKEMISDLMPVGVSLSGTTFSGTLKITNNKLVYGNQELKEKYPVLYPAWSESQTLYMYEGKDVGLSGYGEVPELFAGAEKYKTKGTYSGGTLSLIVE